MTFTISIYEKNNNGDDTYIITTKNPKFEELGFGEEIHVDKGYLFIAMNNISYKVNNVFREECLFEVVDA